MTEWDLTQQILDIEAANTDVIIQTRLRELGWIPVSEVEEKTTKIGSFEIVSYDEETGHMIVDLDHATVKSLVSYGLNQLLRTYCEQVILEAKEESGRGETAEELKAMHQSTEQAAQNTSYETKDIPL